MPDDPFIPGTLCVLDANHDQLDPGNGDTPRTTFDPLRRARCLQRAWLARWAELPAAIHLTEEPRSVLQAIRLHLGAVADFQARTLAAHAMACRQAVRANKHAPALPGPNVKGDLYRWFYQLDGLYMHATVAIALPAAVLDHARRFGPDHALASPALCPGYTSRHSLERAP